MRYHLYGKRNLNFRLHHDGSTTPKTPQARPNMQIKTQIFKNPLPQSHTCEEKKLNPWL